MNKYLVEGEFNLTKVSFLKYSLRNIKKITLTKNKMSLNGVKLLIKSDLPNLEDLRLNSCSIGSAGFEQLIKSHWP